MTVISICCNDSFFFALFNLQEMDLNASYIS
jgi:hypothetical protein